MSRRLQRVNELLLRELSDLIQHHLNDPRVAMMTSVTEVDTSQDLHYSKVYVSVMGAEQERRDTMAALTAASKFLQRMLKDRVTLRYIPNLHFVSDTSIERGARLQELIKQVSSS